MSILINILLVIFVIVSVLMVLVTLMQRPKNEGLGAAFGGGMTENLFGAQTSNVLATFTRWLGGVYFALALILSMLYTRSVTAKSEIQRELLSKPKPHAAATPEASGTATSDAAATARQGVINAINESMQTTGSTATPSASPEASSAPSPTALPSASPAASPSPANPTPKP